jgi:hypothetical protein
MGRCGSDRLEALTPKDVAAISERGRRRVLPWFARRNLLDAHDMLAWTNSAFSLEASACRSNHSGAAFNRLGEHAVRITSGSQANLGGCSFSMAV